MTAFVGEVHPLADVFPMLDQASVDALGADIKANGLRDPLALDWLGRLVDGRNRLAACRLAGVYPTYVTLPELKDEEAIAAYIASKNLQRRDLTQGQKAHLAVRLYQFGTAVREVAKVAGVPPMRVQEAQVIAKWCPDLPAQVIAGAMPHAGAYAQAQAVKDEATAAERAKKQAAEALADLRTNRPDLATLVDEDRLPLTDALDLRRRDAEKERRRAEADAANARQRSEEWNVALAVIKGTHHPEALTLLRSTYRPGAYECTPAELHRIADLLHDIADRWDDA